MIVERLFGGAAAAAAAAAAAGQLVTLLPHLIHEPGQPQQRSSPCNSNTMTTTSSLVRTFSFRASAVQAVGSTCHCVRYAHTASSSQWLNRQANDHFTKQARFQGLRCRAAFKLLEINDTHKIFKPQMTVVDLVPPPSRPPPTPPLTETGLCTRLMERGSSPPPTSPADSAAS